MKAQLRDIEPGDSTRRIPVRDPDRRAQCRRARRDVGRIRLRRRYLDGSRQAPESRKIASRSAVVGDARTRQAQEGTEMAREPGVSIDARQRAVRYDVDGVAATREGEKRYAGARGDRAWLQKLAQGFGQRKRLRQRTSGTRTPAHRGEKT